MVANTEFQLLHPRINQALVDLSNAEKTIRKPLYERQAAGQLKLIYALFPPEGFRHNSVPACFTFDFEQKYVATFELRLMVQLVKQAEWGDPNTFVLGLVSHDQWRKIREAVPSRAGTVDIDDRWVGVRYSPVNRIGDVFLSRKMYDLLLNTPMDIRL